MDQRQKYFEDKNYLKRYQVNKVTNYIINEQTKKLNIVCFIFSDTHTFKEEIESILKNYYISNVKTNGDKRSAI